MLQVSQLKTQSHFPGFSSASGQAFLEKVEASVSEVQAAIRTQPGKVDMLKTNANICHTFSYPYFSPN
jgi:hypothetical protein